MTKDKAAIQAECDRLDSANTKHRVMVETARKALAEPAPKPAIKPIDIRFNTGTISFISRNEPLRGY